MSSKRITVGIVSEGAMDQFVLNIILEGIAFLNNIDYEVRSIQPKYDAINNTWEQGGWGLVYNWCKNTVKAYGSIDSFIKNTQIDILVLHIDADVMYKSYSSCPSITPVPSDYPLPISTPCPSSKACTIPCHATKAIPLLIQSWLNLTTIPNNIVLCTPSKSMDAWVIATMPMIVFNKRKTTDPTLNTILNRLECSDNPERCYEYSDRIGKSLRSYSRYKQTILNNLNDMFQKCIMARIFENEISSKLMEMANV